MTIKPGTVLKDYEGKDLVILESLSDGKMEQKKVTVRLILVSLLRDYKASGVEEAMRCHKLAMKLWDEKEVNIISDDVVLLKKVISDGQINNLAKGRLLELLAE